MSITSNFLSAFDPKNKTHVDWLANMMDLAETMGDPSKSINMVNDINKNPMGIKLNKMDALDWPHIHFVLCASYAKSVLKGYAYIPQNDPCKTQDSHQT
jgi:hypothetical protein